MIPEMAMALMSSTQPRAVSYNHTYLLSDLK